MHQLCMYSLAEGQLGCFHILIIKIHKQVFVWIHISRSGAQFLNRMVRLYLPLWQTMTWSSQVSVYLYIFISSEWEFLLCFIFAGRGIVSILDSSQFNRCVMVSHCCLNLLFYNGKSCSVSFHMLICHVNTFIGEVSVQIICSFSNGVV